MEKLRITVTDFLPQWNKYPIGSKDKYGREICYGHTVKDDRGEEHLIAYRYGKTVLKQPFTIFYASITEYANIEILNKVTACEEWLIIGYKQEPFIRQLITAGIF